MENIFSLMYGKYKITKPIRLIELFAGYGSQYYALKQLAPNCEHYKICEWATKSIQAYNDLHLQDYFDYSYLYGDDEIFQKLADLGVSFDYNKPMTIEEIKRRGSAWARNVYNNIIATKNLVDISKVKGGDLGIGDKDLYEYIMTYSFPCVTKDSLILTKNGYIPMSDVKVGDYVLTKSNTWQKVEKKFDNGIHQTCYLDALGFENIHCTLNHKFYIRELYRKWNNEKRTYVRKFKEPVFKEAKDLVKGDYFGVPVLKETIPFYTNDLDFWYMIGAYLGDGWLTKAHSEIIIACNEDKLNLLKEKLDKSKWHYTYSWNRTCYRFRFSNKEVYDFIKQYIGTGCENKKIPYEILCLPSKQLLELYNGYLNSDGCRIDNYRQFTSVNKNLIYSMSLIINKLFKMPTRIYKIKVSPTKVIENRIVNQKSWYQLRFKTTIDKQDKAFYEDGYIWYPFNKLTLAEKENVYNIEVQNDHSYIIQNCISKNCQDLSLAGKKAGLGEETRSGLLWQVQRILNELKDRDELPQVLLMENVPQLVNKNNFDAYAYWEQFLNSLGYSNFIKVLNATNYCIPQNRERIFMVSILGDNVGFTFPEQIPLKYYLKDFEEQDVDQKYFLSEKQLNDVAQWNAFEKPLEKLERTEQLNISPTLTTRTGAYAAGMILIKNATKQGYLVAEEGDGINICGRMQYQRGNVQKGITQTITTKGGNNIGVVVKKPSEIGIRKLTEKECFRLMGICDEDFERIAKNQTSDSLYHLAGDSIVTTVLMAIFGELLNVDCKDKIDKLVERLVKC